MKFNLKVINNLSREYGDLETLEKFKFPNGHAFPKSYKDFVIQYGYGLTLEEFHIYIPMHNYCDSLFVMSESIKNTYINDVNNGDIWFELKPDGSVDLLKNLYPFASSDNGYFLFWDLNSYKNHEFDVFITDFRGLGFRRISSNLYDFLDFFTTENRVATLPFFTTPLKNTFEILKPFDYPE